jgi:hypothetical protein
LITRSIFSEEYRSFSFSLCCTLHSPIVSSLSGPNVLKTKLLAAALYRCEVRLFC